MPGNLASIFGSVISDTDINVASPSSESTAVGASRQAVAEAISDNGRRAHTTANPADIDGVADPGSGAAVNHPNHVHALETDTTLEFTDAGVLEVSISDVVEHLQQRIQYYTNDNDHSTDGSAAGMVYNTSNYPKNIATIKADVRPTTGSIYKAGIYTVTSGNQIISVLGQSADSDEVPANTTRILTFSMLDSEDDALGVPLAGGERVAVLIRRVGAGNTADTHCRRGSHAGNSPNASYPDAALDFDDDNHVIYEHEDPEAGDDTHSHGNFVRCNIRIFYTVVIDHGSLVGDGNVHPDHIDSGSVQADYALLSDGAGASSFEPINITDVEVIGNAWNHILDGLGSTHNIGEAFDILDDLRFVELEDTPSAITADECVQGNSAGNALVFGSCGSGGGGGATGLTEDQATDDTDTTLGTVSGELLAAAVAEFESAGGGGGGSGYGDWASIGSVTGSISGNPVTVALNANETINDYEELYIHIEANDTNDQRVVSGRFRVSDVPTTTLAGGGLGIPFAGNATDEGAILVRRNADGDSLVLDVFGSVINFPATTVTSIYARELTAGGGGGGGTDDQTAAEVTVDTTNFSRNLTSTDDNVQDALETIDGFTQYQGAWQQASWPAGVIVTRSGIAYISLVNANTEIPTPSSTQWSGLPEGFTYRGEAPILATNYNYGQIVYHPGNENHYYFTSTISASVARADIPTHANFAPVTHKLTNAEATDDLSTVYGAVTGELMAASVAANEDVANSVALAYTQGSRSLALNIGRTIGADLSDQTTLPVLSQSEVEDETSAVAGLVTGERLAQAVAVFAPAASAPDRIVLADAVGVSNAAGPHEITLTEAMMPRQLLSFFVFSSAAASPDGIGYLLSDDLLALTAEATTPTDAENSLPVVTASYSAASFSQQSGNYFVYRKDDSTLWVRPTRLAAHTLTITATPLGGGGSTAGQQAAAGRVLVQRNIITARSPLSEFSFTTEWDEVDGTQPTFTAIPKADFVQIDLGFYVNSEFVYPITLTRAMVMEMGPISNPLTPGLLSSSIVPGAFLTFRTIATADSREPVLLSPKYSYMEGRRGANRCGIFVNMNDDNNDDWAAVGVHVMCNDQVDWEYARAYYYEDAN